MGGIPTNFHGEVVTLNGDDPDAVVPGLMAVGEAACVSVHGANRLGSNSLIDLVVFGRAVGLYCGETIKAGASQPEPEAGLDRRQPRPLRPAAPRLGLDAHRRAAPRHAEGHAGGRRRLSAPARPCRAARNGWTTIQAAPPRHAVTDRGMIWNTDLVETLEFDNLVGQASSR